jgi:hypothetical protein
MAGQQQQYSSRYPNLLITVKRETDQRSVPETYSNPRTRHSKDAYRPSSFQPKNVYYNSKHQQQQQKYFIRPSPCPQQQSFYNSYDRSHYHNQHQPIRPLMEIKDNLFPLHDDNDHDNDDDDDDDNNNEISYRPHKQREPKQRGQYRNRKAELDWDHAFDLDLIDLYTPHIDVDSRSLTSTISSSDNSYSSV